MTDLPTVPCKLCGKPIVWGVSLDRKTRIPLDPRPPCYLAYEQGGVIVADRHVGAMVSHFATCPNVGDLKRKPKTEAAPA